MDNVGTGCVVDTLGLGYIDDVDGSESSVDNGAAAMGKHILARDGVGQEDAVEDDVDVLLLLDVNHLVRRRIDADTRVGVAEVQAV